MFESLQPFNCHHKFSDSRSGFRRGKPESSFRTRGAVATKLPWRTDDPVARAGCVSHFGRIVDPPR